MNKAEISARDSFPEGKLKIIHSIAGQNPLTKKAFTWTTCQFGDLFDESDTLTLWSHEYFLTHTDCLAFLNCTFENLNSIKIIYQEFVNTPSQIANRNPDNPFSLPRPDSLITFPDSTRLRIEYVDKETSLVYHIYKENVMIYSLCFFSLSEETDPKDKRKYYLLKFIKEKYKH